MVRHQIDKIMRKSIEGNRTELNRNTPNMNSSSLKANTNFYKRMITYNPDKDIKGHRIQEAIGEYIEPTKTIKFLPKRLNKLAHHKLTRRHTEL